MKKNNVHILVEGRLYEKFFFYEPLVKVNLHMYNVDLDFPKQMISHSLMELLCMTKCFECGELGQIKGFSHFSENRPKMIGHLVKAMHTSFVILLYMYMFKIVT